MIETEADLAKLTARQREVLIAIVRQLSKEKATRFSQIAETTANIDAEALLQAVAVVREALSKLENSSVPCISPALATLAEEWRALTPSEKAKRKSTNHSG